MFPQEIKKKIKHIIYFTLSQTEKNIGKVVYVALLGKQPTVLILKSKFNGNTFSNETVV